MLFYVLPRQRPRALTAAFFLLFFVPPPGSHQLVRAFVCARVLAREVVSRARTRAAVRQHVNCKGFIFAALLRAAESVGQAIAARCD